PRRGGQRRCASVPGRPERADEFTMEHSSLASDGDGAVRRLAPGGPGGVVHQQGVDVSAGSLMGEAESAGSEPGEPEPAEQVPSERSRAGRDLRAAIAVALGLGVVILVALLTVRQVFIGIVAAAVAVSTIELA